MPFTLPPKNPASVSRRAQVIDLAQAVARRSAAPVLDVVKRRIYRDWLRGVTPRSLGSVYRDPLVGVLKVEEVDGILREQARLERERAA